MTTLHALYAAGVFVGVALFSFIRGFVGAMPRLELTTTAHRRFEVSREVDLSYDALRKGETGELGARTRALAVTREFERSLADTDSGDLELVVRLRFRKRSRGRDG